jgi:hypothetical protein
LGWGYGGTEYVFNTFFTSLGAWNTICDKVSQYWVDIINGDKYEIDNFYVQVTQQLWKSTISY